MDPISSSNLQPLTTSHFTDHHRPSKRPKILSPEVSLDEPADFSRRRWTSESEHRIYSSKLLHALHRVTSHKSASLPSTSSIHAPKLRQTADRLLALAAKGNTRWSRAILTNPRLQRKLNKHKKVKPLGNCSRPKKLKIRYETRKLPTVQRKVRTLSRLVPGCRKISFPNLLEEASDYIAALQMQVRAMTAVAELIVGASGDRQSLGTNS